MHIRKNHVLLFGCFAFPSQPLYIHSQLLSLLFAEWLNESNAVFLARLLDILDNLSFICTFQAGPSKTLETPLLGTGKTDLFPEGPAGESAANRILYSGSKKSLLLLKSVFCLEKIDVENLTRHCVQDAPGYNSQANTFSIFHGQCFTVFCR